MEPYFERRVGACRLQLWRGDLTEHFVDAIVNSADSRLSGGGGLDAAIHSAGGPVVGELCRQIGSCPAGEAVVTEAGNLPARFLIHAVGPIWSGGSKEDSLLESAYRNSLRLAVEKGAQTIALPSIGTGVHGFHPERVSRLALRTVVDFIKEQPGLEMVRFVLFDEFCASWFEKAARDIIDGTFFGCYRRFYRELEGAYLDLLHLDGSLAQEELSRACRRPTWVEDSLRLLADGNWRSHLPPAVSLFLSSCRPRALVSALWEAVGRGSWVIPQLLAVLSQVDSNFQENLEKQLNQGIHRVSSGSSLADHVKGGPGNDRSRLGKLANSALGLVRAGHVAKPTRRVLMKLEELGPDDFDKADEIAATWLPRLLELKRL